MIIKSVVATLSQLKHVWKAMTAKDALGVLIRTAGLLLMAFGLYDVFYSIVETAGFAPHSQIPATQHCFFGFGYFVAGVLIVKCANRLTDFAYEQKQPRK